MSRPFFYILLLIFNIFGFPLLIRFYFFEFFISGGFFALFLAIITFIIPAVTYEILRKKGVINKKLDVPDKKSGSVIIFIILALIITEIVIILMNNIY